MCFSAGASFTAGAVLTAAGVATVSQAKKKETRLFSLIPLIFGIQQIAEGVIWLTLNNPGHYPGQSLFMYIFLAIADVVWPTFIPASIMLMEENPGKRKVLKYFVVSGAVVSLYYAICLAVFKTTPEILNCHINYKGTFIPALMVPMFLLYLISTITPFFISGIRGMKWLGLAMFISVLVSVIFYFKNITSVWCFFAAVISVIVFVIIKKENPRTT